MSARRLLVIGCNGFIGRHVVIAAERSGMEVHGFDRAAPSRQSPLAGFHAGSLADPVCLERVFAAVRPDRVISLAAHAGAGSGPGLSAERDIDAAFAVNVEGFRSLVATCRARGVSRLVWASSTTVLGQQADHATGLVDETASRFPAGIYGLTKSLAEEIGTFAHRHWGLEVVAVRPTLVLGPGHPYGGLLDPLKALFEACHPVAPPTLEIGWGRHLFDIVHVDDVAAAFVALAAAPPGLRPLYHVNGGTTDIDAIAALARAARPELDLTVRDEAPPVVFPLVAADRIAADIGFRARYGADETIRRCIEHARNREECYV